MIERRHFEEGLFYEGENGPRLLGNRCSTCGKVFFPQATFCSSCLGKEFEPKELSTEGELNSWTVTMVPVAQYPIPHAVGRVSLPQDELDIIAPLVIEDPDDPCAQFRIGKKLELVVDTFWKEEDAEVIGYKFRVVEEDKS